MSTIACPTCHEQKRIKTTVREWKDSGALSQSIRRVWRHECHKCETRWNQDPESAEITEVIPGRGSISERGISLA